MAANIIWTGIAFAITWVLFHFISSIALAASLAVALVVLLFMWLLDLMIKDLNGVYAAIDNINDRLDQLEKREPRT